MIGIPEIIVILVFSGLSLLPIAVAVWAIVTLNRVRQGQETLKTKLEHIERLLQRA